MLLLVLNIQSIALLVAFLLLGAWALHWHLSRRKRGGGSCSGCSCHCQFNPDPERRKDGKAQGCNRV